MRSHIVGCMSGLLLVAFTPITVAQKSGISTTEAVREVRALETRRLVNDGADFGLICRGGAWLKFDTSHPYPAPATTDLPGWVPLVTLTVEYIRSAQPPSASGRYLRPGECSPVGFPLRDFDPGRIQIVIITDGQWRQVRDGLPRDVSPNMAERYPDSRNVPMYLKDPKHYWMFGASDKGDGYFLSGASGHWKPELYKGPETSSFYQPSNAAAAKTDTIIRTVLDRSPRLGSIGLRTEGHAGAPAVPSPASPAPPPIVAVPAAVLPVVFSPPLLEDGAQLWACVDAAEGEANEGACSGTESAQAYCQLRDAQSGPDLLIADAQAGIPVRAVNGDVCPGEACRVLSQLQCDH